MIERDRQKGMGDKGEDVQGHARTTGRNRAAITTGPKRYTLYPGRTTAVLLLNTERLAGFT